MLLTFLLRIIFKLFDFIFSLLPDIVIDKLDTVFYAIRYVIDLALYFLPVWAIKIVLSYIMIKFTFKLTLSLFRLAKNVLPFV